MKQPLKNARHVLEALEHNALSKNWPDAIIHCMDKNNVCISYEQLVQCAKRWAKALSSCVSEGDRVLIIMPAGLDFHTAFCACLYLGAIAVPLPRPRGQKGRESLNSIVNDAKPTALIIGYNISDLNLGVKIFTVSELDSEHELLTNITLKPDAIAVLQYTSGSTGVPKAVVISNLNLLSNSRAIGKVFQHSSQSRGLVWLPHYHDMGLIGGIVHPFVEGFRTGILCPFKFMQRPSRWLRAISDMKVNTSGGPNFAFAECVKRISDEEIIGLDLSSWDLAFVGAEPVRDEILNRFAVRFSSIGFNKKAFFPCYGLAEATLMVSGGPKGAALNVKKLNGKTFVDSGPPIDGCSVVIVNPVTLEVVANGGEGEIWVQGANVAEGYWNNDEASLKSFNAILPSNSKSYLRTGDSGYFYNGRLVVCGRIKDLIIIRGTNHHPEDIEKTCSEASPELWGMANAAISITTDNEEKLVIVQEVNPLSDRTTIKKEVKQNIFQVHGINVHDFVLVKQRSLPKTSSGKVKRRETQRLYSISELSDLESA